MQADVMKAAERGAIPHDDDALGADVGGEILAGNRHLVGATDELPGAPEDLVFFEREIDWIDIQARWYGRGPADIGIKRKDQRHRGLRRARG